MYLLKSWKNDMESVMKVREERKVNILATGTLEDLVHERCWSNIVFLLVCAEIP